VRVIASILLLLLLLSAPDLPAADDKALNARAERQRMLSVLRSRPKRVDGPLREENISDREVLEIEAVMAEKFPGSIVNISGVVDGCPCADGVLCDSQVWVVAHQVSRNNGLMLSRIGANWRVGPLQQWWIRYDRIRSLINKALASNEADRFERVRDLQEQQNLLQESFPSCEPEHN
jgi:hypothetical protein